jgi:hypothetical protein
VPEENSQRFAEMACDEWNVEAIRFRLNLARRINTKVKQFFIFWPGLIW